MDISSWKTKKPREEKDHMHWCRSISAPKILSSVEVTIRKCCKNINPSKRSSLSTPLRKSTIRINPRKKFSKQPSTSSSSSPSKNRCLMTCFNSSPSKTPLKNASWMALTLPCIFLLKITHLSGWFQNDHVSLYLLFCWNIMQQWPVSQLFSALIEPSLLFFMKIGEQKAEDKMFAKSQKQRN